MSDNAAAPTSQDHSSPAAFFDHARPGDFEGRVAALLATYGAADASMAGLLCDGWPAEGLAYRIVKPDLTHRDLSYGELRRDSERFAAALNCLGVRPGNRVATLMGKGRDYLVALLGIWRAGAVHVPLFTAFAPPAIELRLRASGAVVLICDEGQRPKLASADFEVVPAGCKIVTTGEPDADALSFAVLLAAQESGFPAVAVGGDGPIIHIFTSGTTGAPKAVVVPLRAVASFRAYAEFALHLQPGDLYWCAADPGWAYGLYFGVISSLSTGTPSLMYAAQFSAEGAVAVLSSQPVTNFSAAPTIYRSIMASGLGLAGTAKLRCASSAGEPLTPDINEWARAELGLSVADHYGQTETGMLINNHHHPELACQIIPGSMGQVMPGWHAVVLADERDEPVAPGTPGRVAMDLQKSPLAWFNGYLGDEQKSRERFAGAGQWYLTGDRGLVDEGGHFRFSARDDDVIIMAGYRIGPVEVETVLSAHPSVLEAAVIAVPDTVRGEVIEAFVILQGSATPSSSLEEELKVWVKDRYAAHAYPRAIHFERELPRTPSGKVQRFVLRQRRRDELAAARST